MDTIKSCTNCMYYSTNKHGFWEPRCIDCGDESTADNPYPLWASSYPNKVEAGKPSDWENDSDECPNCVSDYKCNGPHILTQMVREELDKLPMSDEPQPKDMVNKPNHYMIRDGLEVIDVRDALFDKMDETGPFTYKQADYWSRAWEYITRATGKNGLEDLKKGRFYLDRLIKDMEQS